MGKQIWQRSLGSCHVVRRGLVTVVPLTGWALNQGLTCPTFSSQGHTQFSSLARSQQLTTRQQH